MSGVICQHSVPFVRLSEAPHGAPCGGKDIWGGLRNFERTYRGGDATVRDVTNKTKLWRAGGRTILDI